MTNDDTSVHTAYLDVSAHLFRGLFSRTHLLYAVVRGVACCSTSWQGRRRFCKCLPRRNCRKRMSRRPRSLTGSRYVSREGFDVDARDTARTVSRDTSNPPPTKSAASCTLFRGRCRAGNLLQGSNGPIRLSIINSCRCAKDCWSLRAPCPNPLNPGHKLGRGWSGVSSGR